MIGHSAYEDLEMYEEELVAFVDPYQCLRISIEWEGPVRERTSCLPSVHVLPRYHERHCLQLHFQPVDAGGPPCGRTAKAHISLTV